MSWDVALVDVAIKERCRTRLAHLRLRRRAGAGFSLICGAGERASRVSVVPRKRYLRYLCSRMLDTANMTRGIPTVLLRVSSAGEHRYARCHPASTTDTADSHYSVRDCPLCRARRGHMPLATNGGRAVCNAAWFLQRRNYVNPLAV